jgi:hypothetical protein
MPPLNKSSGPIMAQTPTHRIGIVERIGRIALDCLYAILSGAVTFVANILLSMVNNAREVALSLIDIPTNTNNQIEQNNIEFDAGDKEVTQETES